MERLGHFILEATIICLLTGFSSRKTASRVHQIREGESRTENVASTDGKEILMKAYFPTTVLKYFSIFYSAAGAVYHIERYAFLMLCCTLFGGANAILIPNLQTPCYNVNLPRYALDTLHAK